ncbi:hypothetical protein pb186bvf_001375 [Paramecium bursaria]
MFILFLSQFYSFHFILNYQIRCKYTRVSKNHLVLKKNYNMDCKFLYNIMSQFDKLEYDKTKRVINSTLKPQEPHVTYITESDQRLLQVHNSTESKHSTFSRTNSHRKLSSGYIFVKRKKELLELFKKRIRILIIIQGFIKELKQYSDQLRTQHLEFLFRKRSHLPLFPDDKFLMIWNEFIQLIHFICTVLFPLTFAFNFESNGRYVTSAIQIILALDVVMNFISCHVDKNHNLIYKWPNIIHDYITGWFIFDIISILPYEQFDQTNFNIVKIFRVLKSFTYVRKFDYRETADMIKKKQEIVQDSLDQQSDVWIDIRKRKLIMIIVNMLILSHVFCCIWIWSSRIQGFGPNTWMNVYDMLDESDYRVYLTAFYWSFETVTVIGYGELKPSCWLEYIISIIWLLLGVGFYSFTIGNITFILATSNPFQELEEELAIIEDLTLDSNFPQNIQAELHQFVKFNSARNPFWSSDSKNIIETLPHQLQKFAVIAAHKEIFSMLPFFANDLNFSSAVLPYITIAKYHEYDNIYHIGQNAADFYFLINGDVRLTNQMGESLINISEGSVFGEIETIEQTLRTLHAICFQKTTVLICPSKFFFKLVKENTSLYFELQQLYKRRKLILSEQQKVQRQQQRKLRRYRGIVDDSHILPNPPNMAKRQSQIKREFKDKIDVRPYQSLQQDLLIQLVGQRQARRRLLREKFRQSVNKIKQVILRAKRRGGVLQMQDPDYDIIKKLVETVRANTNPFTTNDNQIGKKMLENFQKVCKSEIEVKIFINKHKKESLERLYKLKLQDLVSNILLKKQLQYKREQIIYYSHFHQQIYEEHKEENKFKVIHKKEQVDRWNISSYSKLKKLERWIRIISQKQGMISMNKFELHEAKNDLDEVLYELQVLIMKI